MVISFFLVKPAEVKVSGRKLIKTKMETLEKEIRNAPSMFLSNIVLYLFWIF